MNLLPLILTLKLDEESHAFFNKLRTQYFPPERNYLEAHLTLFHQLPASEPAITDVLKQVCIDTIIFEMEVSSIVSIGNGVAYKVESPELQALHKHLQNRWQQWLIPQDRQKLWPHITIQNKTDAHMANQLINNLKVDFKPFNIHALGFKLWEYQGGRGHLSKLFVLNNSPFFFYNIIHNHIGMHARVLNKPKMCIQATNNHTC